MGKLGDKEYDREGWKIKSKEGKGKVGR